MKTVIAHSEKGVLLGLLNGQAFWSANDWADWTAEGNRRVVLFDDDTSARAHIASWDDAGSSNDPADYAFLALPLADGLEHASPDELRAAGLDALLAQVTASAPAP